MFLHLVISTVIYARHIEDGKVLIVEDEAIIAEHLRMMLIWKLTDGQSGYSSIPIKSVSFKTLERVC